MPAAKLRPLTLVAIRTNDDIRKNPAGSWCVSGCILLVRFGRTVRRVAKTLGSGRRLATRGAIETQGIEKHRNRVTGRLEMGGHENVRRRVRHPTEALLCLAL